MMLIMISYLLTKSVFLEINDRCMKSVIRHATSVGKCFRNEYGMEHNS